MEILPGIAAMFFWGVAIYLAATVSRKIGNYLTLFWMQVFGLIVGSIYFALNFQNFNLAAIPSFIPILTVIAILQIIAYLSFYKGTEMGKVSLVGPLGAAWGLVVAVLGVIFYRESLKPTQVIAVLLIIAGIILISIDLKSFLKSKQIQLLSGMKEGVIAMLGWGVSLFLLVIPTRNLDWFLPAFLFRAILILLLGLYIASKTTFKPKTNKLPLKSLAIIGLFDMGAFMSLSFGLSNSNSSVIAPIASAYAVITVLLAKVFLKEKTKPSQALGIVGVVAGIILISL